MSDVERLDQLARDISAWAEPRRWRLLAHRRWRRHQQPDAIRARLAYLVDFELTPLDRIGVVVAPPAKRRRR